MSEEVDYEAEARQDGWVPQEEWKGDPDKWVDAEKFVENGKKINGILKSKVEKLESKLEENLRTTQEFKEWTEKQREKERKELKSRIEQLEAEREQAISEGDGQKFTKVDKEIRDLEKSQDEKPAADKEFEAIVAQWQADNTWYKPGSDDEMSIYADGIADRVAKQGFTGRQYFNEITERVKARFPENFGNPRRKDPPSVESPGASRERPSNGRSYNDLPPADKAQCDRFVKEIPGFTKEQFLEQYDWDEE